MKDVWRDSNGQRMRSEEGIEAIESWSTNQLALLPEYQRSIVRDDQKLIERAMSSDAGSRPAQPSQQPTQTSPERQQLIDDARRRRAIADSVVIGGRCYFDCRVPD